MKRNTVGGKMRWQGRELAEAKEMKVLTLDAHGEKKKEREREREKMNTRSDIDVK